MVDMTREHQRRGDFTALEISEKEFHDYVTNLIREHLGLIKDQKEYGKTIKRATTWTAIATVVIAAVMIMSYIFRIT